MVTPGALRDWFVRLSRRIWVRASLFSAGAVATALLAGFAAPYMPYEPKLTLAAGSVDHILAILAASMLTVTTFSLSIMVSALASASSGATPRATRLLREDSVAQNTLATFIGSFLFAIVGIIGLAGGLYAGGGRIILFGATLVVLIIITVMLLRWIEQLSSFGLVGDTIRRIEAATLPAARRWGAQPRQGAQPPVGVPADAQPIAIEQAGFVIAIDCGALSQLAARLDTTVHVAVVPGAFVHPARPVAHVVPPVDASAMADLAGCFAVSDERSFDNDLRFGLVVLSEVGSRALSPAVNDPGTAILVIAAGVRVLLAHASCAGTGDAAAYPRVHAPDLEVEALFEGMFAPIARDGAALIEVQLRLQEALEALALGQPARFGRIARAQARRAAQRAEGALGSDHDLHRLRRAAAWVDAPL